MTDDRRERYAAAMLDALAQDTSHGPNWGAAADAAIAVADEELQRAGNWLAIARARAREGDEENARLRAELETIRGHYHRAVTDRNTHYATIERIRAALEAPSE